MVQLTAAPVTYTAAPVQAPRREPLGAPLIAAPQRVTQAGAQLVAPLSGSARQVVRMATPAVVTVSSPAQSTIQPPPVAQVLSRTSVVSAPQAAGASVTVLAPQAGASVITTQPGTSLGASTALLPSTTALPVQLSPELHAATTSEVAVPLPGVATATPLVFSGAAAPVTTMSVANPPTPASSLAMGALTPAQSAVLVPPVQSVQTPLSTAAASFVGQPPAPATPSVAEVAASPAVEQVHQVEVFSAGGELPQGGGSHHPSLTETTHAKKKGKKDQAGGKKKKAKRKARAQSLAEVCAHESWPTVSGDVEIAEGQTVYREIFQNMTHRFRYSNVNVGTMNKPDSFRKLIINLEPCRGTVYLFVRKTRRCYPNPYSCINLATGFRDSSACRWTHFMSEIDGSQDGIPTFFELPLSSTKFYISVFATQKSSYTLTVLADIGAFPRPGSHGRLWARQLRELQVEVEWDEAGYIPADTTSTNRYWVYSSMLLETDQRTNTAVFLRPDKIMNTVCGLENNTDRQYTIVNAADCVNGRCKAAIDPVITEKRYVFNIVAESGRGYKMAYAGLIMRTDWEVVRQHAPDATLRVIGAVCGSVMGMVVIIFFVLLKLYG